MKTSNEAELQRGSTSAQCPLTDVEWQALQRNCESLTPKLADRYFGVLTLEEIQDLCRDAMIETAESFQRKLKFRITTLHSCIVHNHLIDRLRKTGRVKCDQCHGDGWIDEIPCWHCHHGWKSPHEVHLPSWDSVTDHSSADGVDPRQSFQWSSGWWESLNDWEQKLILAIKKALHDQPCIVWWNFMMPPRDQLTNADLAKILGRSKESIRQIQSRSRRLVQQIVQEHLKTKP